MIIIKKTESKDETSKTTMAERPWLFYLNTYFEKQGAGTMAEETNHTVVKLSDYDARPHYWYS